jgi:hypothetical protein
MVRKNVVEEPINGDPIEEAIIPDQDPVVIEHPIAPIKRRNIDQE